MNIPQELKSVPGWLVWKYVKRHDEGKPRKVPFYVNGSARRGKQGSPEDRKQLATYDAAVAAAKQRGMQGVGLALLPEWGITALDFDNCVRPDRGYDGVALADIQDTVLSLIVGTYAEVSPSGKGVRAFYLGAAGDHKSAANDLYPFGYETFTAKGFVTVTGRGLDVDELAGPYLATLPEKVRQHCRERFGEGFDRARSHTKPDPDKPATDIAKVREALFAHDPTCSEPEWFRILAAVHYETNGSDEGLALATEWSSGGKNFTGASSVRQRWSRFDLSHDEPRTLASLRKDRPATADDFDVIEEGTTVPESGTALRDSPDEGGPLHQFYAHLPDHRYIHRKTGKLWPAASIDSKFKGLMGKTASSTWLDQQRGVVQMTWDPARPEIVEDCIVVDGGWIASPGQRVYNTYKPPLAIPGDAALAAPWVQHVERLYQDDAAHIISWLAHRVQFPGEKVNHALVLAGNHGAGKDTVVEGAKQAVGEANFKEIDPTNVLDRWNDWCMAVLVKINEANDRSGEFDRWKFYEHTKKFFAAPPAVLRVDQKHVQQFPVMNVAGYIITTNHKTGGLVFAADDRRHYVCWSNLTRDQMGGPAYFDEMYDWLDNRGGRGHVAAYLRQYDLSHFRPKAPPPQTQAFLDMVSGGKSDEELQLIEALESMDSPEVFTLQQLEFAAPALVLGGINQKLLHMLRRGGYDVFRNPDGTDGRWRYRVDGEQRKLTIYARASLSEQDKLAATTQLLASMKANT